MCWNPFGILDNQLLLECPTEKCAEQYCNGCVKTVRGSDLRQPFVCISCRKYVIPEQNILIGKYIIWKSKYKQYGIEKVLALIDLKSKSLSCQPVWKNIELQRLHLQLRFDAFRNKLEKVNPNDIFDELLIQQATNLCNNLQVLANQMKDKKEEMNAHDITVVGCLNKYRRSTKGFHFLCGVLVNIIVKLEANDNSDVAGLSNYREAHLKDVYNMKQLKRLPSEQNDHVIDKILYDLYFRKEVLSTRLNTVTL
jgi:hypothetical protein